MPLMRQKEIKMKKTVKIGGMMCEHCSSRAEKGLNAVDGITAKVDLKSATATLELADGISDDMIKELITDMGFDCLEIN